MACTLQRTASLQPASLASCSRPFTPIRPLRATRSIKISVQAMKTPAGVTQPPQQPSVPPPKNGFVDYAERMNSRAAMIGFFALLAVEGITGKGLLELIGLTVGLPRVQGWARCYGDFSCKACGTPCQASQTQNLKLCCSDFGGKMAVRKMCSYHLQSVLWLTQHSLLCLLTLLLPAGGQRPWLRVVRKRLSI